ncbi:hypothetical protein jhhlp_000129 [Lomentospora prolificans]|uniref:alpha-1,2-Mannosidase n=1 Tax=Lomentospora prolificans TaxID=41688 RepID=A0A2N3NLR9_9PEZI|nr:hypothetical protein jhhlp_000129 [Lomentospora prolificans]
MLSSRCRSRYILLGLFTTFFFYCYLSSEPEPGYTVPLALATSALASERLEWYMNHNPPPSPPSTKSFDWGKVPVANRPGRLTHLPSGRPKDLPPIQYNFPLDGWSRNTAKQRETRRQQVKALFFKNWDSYRKYAWKKDALLPLSSSGRDQFSGWAATLVDSLDTLWIMGFRKEFDEAVAAVAEIDFGQSTSTRVNTFETNIRYLGGLLAAYDLSRREILLTKAIELGDLLYTAFDTENRLPVDNIDFERAKEGGGLLAEGIVVAAGPGTLSLEMTRLSQLTGNPKYYDAINRVTRLFAKQQMETSLPGMWPMYVSMAREDTKYGRTFTLGGNADSMYEYLPKMYAMLGGLEPVYEKMSRAFMRTATANLFFRPMVPKGDDILISGNVNVDSEDVPVLDPESEHLACFVGGMMALGGRLFSNQTDVDNGARLAKGCAYVYRSFPTGIMPERFNMVVCPGPDKMPRSCHWDEDVFGVEAGKRPEYKETLPRGFTTAKDPRYLLRPEAIESLFVLYRVTGEEVYVDMAWDMFRAVREGTATEIANAAVLDVTVAKEKTKKGELPKEDYMESFWLAETLKYFYLIFSPPDLISLDDYVLNTEAHPFRRPR